MNRSFFYRLALILFLISTLPFVIFLINRETPPANLKIKAHKEQTIEKFSLRSTGENPWILKSSKAIFKANDIIELKEAVFETLTPPKIRIMAREALFNKGKGLLLLKFVHLYSNKTEAFSPEGTFFTEKGIFKTDKGCKLKSETSITTGQRCILFVKDGKVIIEGRVKSTISEAK